MLFSLFKSFLSLDSSVWSFINILGMPHAVRYGGSVTQGVKCYAYMAKIQGEYCETCHVPQVGMQ